MATSPNMSLVLVKNTAKENLIAKIEKEKERRQMLSEQLESGLFESRREEERARGQISELKLILSLDKYSEQLQNPVKDKRDGTQV